MNSTLSAIMKPSLLVLVVVVAFGGGASGKNIHPVREAARGVLDDPVALIEQAAVSPEVADPEVTVEPGGDDLPLSFEHNLGQAGESVRYLARGARHRLLLSPGELTFVTRGTSPSSRDLTRLVFDGATEAPAIEGIEGRSGRVHYLTGNDPEAWLTNVPTFAAVRYVEVFPGVDLVVRGTRQRISMEIRLAAGANPDVIAFSLKGAQGVEPAADGSLRVLLETGELRLGRPSAHQAIEGAVVEVEASFAEPGFESLGFSLGDYAPEAPLQLTVPVIVLEKVTALRDDDAGVRVAVARDGHIFVAGQVPHSAVTAEPSSDAQPDTSRYGEVLGDAFITKLDADGRTVRWSAYFGGEGEDVPRALTLDPKGGVVVCGSTQSERFPVVSALQPQLAGGEDGFVARLLPDGSGFDYSTYLGTAGNDDVGSVAVDRAGAVWVIGTSDGTGFPVSEDALQAKPGGGRDALVARIASDGSVLEYASYLGGSDSDLAHDIALAKDGEIVVVGSTASGDFPRVNAWQQDRAGGRDAFVTRFSSGGDQVRYSTYLGGSGADVAKAVTLDSEGRVHVAGWTKSADFPSPAHVLQPDAASEGGRDGFVAGLEPDGMIAYATYLGGSADDRVIDVATDGAGRVLVAGATRSGDFPLASPSPNDRSGTKEGFMAALNAEGTELVDASALGSAGETTVSGIAVSPNRSVVVVGATSSREGLPANMLEPADSGGVGFVATFDADSSTDILACSINFIGGDLSDPNLWDDGDNWDTGGIPGPSDTACIGGTHYVYIPSGAWMVDALEITGAGQLDITGGSLDVASASPVGSGGMLILDGGILKGAGDITVDGVLWWKRGTMEGTGDTIVNNSMTMSGTGHKHLNRRLVNSGTTAWSDGIFYLYASAVFDNQKTGGTFDIQGDLQMVGWSGSPQFNNAGDFLKSAGTGTAVVGTSIVFVNTESVDVQVGTLDIQGADATHTGSFDCTGATIDWSAATHTLGASSSVTGSEVTFTAADATILGTYDVDATRIISPSSTVTFDNTSTLNTLELSAGILTGMAAISPTGMITWTGGTMEGTGDTFVNNGMTISGTAHKYLKRRLVNKSTTAWSGGIFYFYDGGIFDNQASGGILDVQGDLQVSWQSGSPPLNNDGILLKSAGTGSATIGASIVFVNTGMVDVQTGTLDILGVDATHTGSFDCTGATIDWSAATHTLGASSIVTGSEVTFTAGDVIVLGTYDVDATRITSGSSTVTFDSVPTMNTLELSNGVLTGTANVAPNGMITWSRGTMEGTGDTIVNNGMTMSGTGHKYLYRRIENSSTTTWSGGIFYFYDGGIFDNQAPLGTLDVQGDLQMVGWSGSPPLNNHGILLKSAGTGSATIGTSIVFVNTGMVDVQTGTLDIQGVDATHTGSFDCTGATIDWSAATHTLGASSIVTGSEVTFTGANLIVLGTYDVDATRITSGSSTVTFDSVPTMNTLELSNGVLTGTANVAPNGMITWSRGTMEGTGDTVVNNGMTMSGTGHKYLYRRIENNSTTTWSGGIFYFYDGGIFDNQAPLGTLDVQGDLQMVGWSGSPPLNNHGILLKSAGTGSAAIGTSIVFVNTGTVDVQTGTLDIQGVDATHTGSFDCTGATIDWSAATHTLGASSSVTGSEVTFTAAYVTVLGTYNVDATRIISPSSTVTFDSVPTMNTLELSAGVLTGTAAISPTGMITWTGGTMEGIGDTVVNNGMTISGTGHKYLYRRIENNSTTTWSGGIFYFYDGGIFDNQAPLGTLDVQGDLQVSRQSGSPQLNNHGTFVRTTGSGIARVNAGILFANTGIVEVRSGVLDIDAAYTQTAGATILNGGDIEKSLLDLDGGELRGTGTVTGDVDISPGATSPGLSAGTISITGSYAQNGSGSYDVEIGGVTPGSGYDRVDLTGAGSASLDGTLDVTLIGGFTPGAGNTFTVMTFPSRVGTFSGVNLPYLGTGFDWQVEYTATAVILRVLASSPGTIPPTVEVDKSSITSGDLTITWDPSCSAGGIDARVYEGTLGTFNSHQAITCTDTGSDRTEDVTPASGDTYYVVVPVGVTSEGSYGTDSTPTQRLPGSPGACTSLPQNFSPCP